MSTLREVQLKGYEILNTVVDLCEKYNITYYLSFGTLLGAIRHDGFIPWDNDIDIEMPTDSYKKFLKIAKKELPKHLFLQTYYTDPGYNEMWAKVRNNDTTSMPLAWKDLDIHWGIGIDIFPLVGIPENHQKRKKQAEALQICRLLLSKDFNIAIRSEELKSKKLRLLYAIPRWGRIAVCRFLEPIVFRDFYKEKQGSIVFERIDALVEKKAYDRKVLKKFEQRDFAIPYDYDHVLTRLYGDYMTPPPENKRGRGHEVLLGDIIYDCDRSYTEYLQKMKENTE